MVEVYDENAVGRCELKQSQARGKWIELSGFRVKTDHRLRCEGFDCFPKLIGVLNYLVVH